MVREVLYSLLHAPCLLDLQDLLHSACSAVACVGLALPHIVQASGSPPSVLGTCPGGGRGLGCTNGGWRR